MKAYIVGGGMDGTDNYNGVYHLVTADGICWATQWCSSFEWAHKDLYEDRAGLQADWAKKYGNVKVMRLGEDDMTFEKLVEREQTYNPMKESKLEDGIYFRVVYVKDGQKHKMPLKPMNELSNAICAAVVDAIAKSGMSEI